MKNKFLGIICLLYSGVIIYIWITGILNKLLAPNVQIYIKLALIPLLIMAIVVLFSHSHYKFKFSDIVLILPLIMLFTCGDGALTTSLAKNKVSKITTNRKVKKKIDEVKEEKLDEVTEYDFSNPYFDIQDNIYADVSGYLSSSDKAVKYEGKTIKVRGFALKYESFLPDGYFALGKYVITCCAADSSFSGFIFKYDSYKIKNNRWYEIEGVLREGKDKKEYSMMYIDVKNIKEIDSSSEEQYVYPCYSYDETCSQLKKYDLSF